MYGSLLQRSKEEFSNRSEGHKRAYAKKNTPTPDESHIIGEIFSSQNPRTGLTGLGQYQMGFQHWNAQWDRLNLLPWGGLFWGKAPYDGHTRRSVVEVSRWAVGPLVGSEVWCGIIS